MQCDYTAQKVMTSPFGSHFFTRTFDAVDIPELDAVATFGGCVHPAVTPVFRLPVIGEARQVAASLLLYDKV